jgi:PadR family transcriptional regulator, regulatory protein PadR
MEEKGNPPVERPDKDYQKFNERSDDDCNPDLAKNLKEYDIKLLRSMKGFGKTMILWLISKERIHGYELMSKLNQINPSVEEKMKGGPGKIYPILHDLEKANLIEGTWEAHGKRKVKYYEITEEGNLTLARIRKVFRCHRTPILEEFWREMFSKKDE